MCESRPSQGQAEPLRYPLLPCVPPGFFTPSSSFRILFFFCQRSSNFSNLCSSAWFFLLLLFSASSGGKNPPKKNRLEKQPPLAALRATYNADPLSKLLCSPFPLAPFPSLPPSLPATVGEELSNFLSFSSPCLALPLPLIVI